MPFLGASGEGDADTTATLTLDTDDVTLDEYDGPMVDALLTMSDSSKVA